MDYNSYEYSSSIIHSLSKKSRCGCYLSDKLDRNLVTIKDWLYHRSTLDDSETELILFRYSRLVKKIRSMYKYYGRCYTFATLFTSIMALVVTALISTSKFDNEIYSTVTWWFSWILSLCISVINTLATFFKWDRKYLLLLQIYNKVEQEIWMFMGLIGPYADLSTEEQPTHSSKLRIFLARIELSNKRLNDNLLDIEDTDQDDKDMLKQREAHLNVDKSDKDSLHELLQTSKQQAALNAGLSILDGDSDIVSQEKATSATELNTDKAIIDNTIEEKN